jgi:hypothetical protein
MEFDLPMGISLELLEGNGVVPYDRDALVPVSAGDLA